LLFFCIFWNGFLVFWYSMAFGQDSPLIMKLFPVLHVAVGVLLTYSTLCGFINRTVIEVTDEELTIRHGPLPWPGNQTLTVPDIRQIYCDETISRGRNSTSTSYNVNALLVEERTIKLLSSLPEKQMALFVEQQLEEWLKIKPQHVKGSIS